MPTVKSSSDGDPSPGRIDVLCVVEGDGEVRSLLAALHRERPRLSVETAADAGVAVARAEEGSVDCVVVGDDGLDGVDVVERVRRADRNMPVILCGPDPGVAGGAFEAGASDFFELRDCPAREELLARRIDAAVERARVTDRLRANRDALAEFHRIVAAEDLSFDGKLRRLLSVGRERLGVSGAHLSRVDVEEGYREVVAVDDEAGFLSEGASYDIDETYCRATVEDGTLALSDPGRQGWADDPAHEQFGLGCYLGRRVTVGDELYGTLCFVDEAPRESFTEAERTLVKVIGEWVGHELQRRETERRFERVLERVRDGVFAVDDDLTVTYFNDRAAEVLDREPETVVGQDLATAFPDAGDRILPAIEEAIETGETVAFEGTNDAEARTLEVRIHPGDDGASVYFRDVTDRVERERRLRRLVEATRTLMAAPDSEAVTGSAVEAVDDVLGFAVAAFRRHDPDAGELRLAGLAGEVESLGDRPPATVEGSPHGRAFRTGEVVVETPDREDDPRDREAFAQVMYVPVGDYGTFSLGIADGEFEAADRRLAQLLAASTERALDRASDREALQRYRNVLETVQGLVFAIDTDGEFTMVTDPLAELTGHDRADLEGRTFDVVLADDGFEDAWEVFREMVEGDRERATLETELVGADGGRVPADIEASTVPSGVAGVVRDRTELRRTREQLDRERDRFTNLFEYLPDPVNEVEFGDDGDGEAWIREVNPAFESTFGYDRERLVGADPNEVLLPGDADGDSDHRLDERARNGEVVTEEVRRETADGLRDFLFRGIPYRTDGETRAFGVYTDITEQKRRRRRLSVLNRVLRHNVRNEMTVVRGYAELLADELDGDERIERAVEELLDSALEVSEISRQARDVEKVFRQGTSGPTDVAAVARRSAEAYRSPGVDLRTDLPDRLPAAVSEGIELAVENLVENDIEHNVGDPTVRVSGRRTPEDAVAVTVADDGPGIPDHERAVVTGEEVTQLEHGSGLGLWIVVWTVEAMGGQVSFGDSDLGGAAVTLSLPSAGE